MLKTYLFFFDIVTIATSSQPHIYCLPQSCSILLVVWSANGDETVGKCSYFQGYFQFTPILLNEDTYRCVCAVKCVIHPENRARCALYKKILGLLDEESISGESRVELVYKSDEKSYCEWKR